MNANYFPAQANHIMRTAFLTAYPKIFTDIEYSTEIFSCMKNLAFNHGFTFQPDQFPNAMALEIEARHKAINQQLNQIVDKDTLVIEVAAGLSPRRLQYPNYDYVELDLQPVVDIKQNIYRSLGYPAFVNNLYAVDLADTNQLRQCLTTILQHHQHKKIVIVSEGLFWYLNKAIITNIAQELTKAFQGYQWCWISADCPPTGADLTDFEYRKTIADSAQVKHGLFTDPEDFKKFFTNCNLTCRCYQLSELIKPENLFSTQFFSVDNQTALNRINSYTSVAVLK